MTDAVDTPLKINRFSLSSFRAKFIVVVGAAVIFDLLLAGGVALWNVHNLSRDATKTVGEGLGKASQEYLETYIETTSRRADLLLSQVHSEVTGLAGSLQGLIDAPDTATAIGATVESNPSLRDNMIFERERGWSQNSPGPSVVSVWGYLLDQQGVPLPPVQEDIARSSAFNLIAPPLMKTGAAKLQLYYVGPKDRPIMRTTPYTDQAQTFDRLYPGHNEANFWDFFFPGVYEGWQSWLKDPTSRPVESDIVTTAPYVDAITGKLIVSFFHPLWTRERSDVAGMAAADITLEQLSSLVDSVEIAETGFGFLAMSNGNIVTIPEDGVHTLGLVSSDVSGQGVTGVSRSLRTSTQPQIASLQLPTDAGTSIKTVHLQEGGVDTPYIVVLRQLSPTNLWDGSGIVGETMTLGFVVPEREIYAALIAAQQDISTATDRIVNWQLLAFFICLMVVFAAVFAISGRITSGLSALATAANRLQQKDYSVRVNIPSRDEVGAVGVAFNRMAEEISYHTENLEKLVEERTRELATANDEISALNARLKSENLRLGAELDVARHIQMMVLPKPAELGTMPTLDVAGYMEPADEVGGDYFDVLQGNGMVKIGIGDVTGHGLESGVLMLMVQSVARALQEKGGSSPTDFLEVLNRAIYKNIERTQTDKHLSLAFLDYKAQSITLSGQHEEVLVMREDGEIDRIDTIDLGFPIGLESDISSFVATRDIPFAPGDTIILHTDGVTEAEAPDGGLFGMERLCESIRRHRNGDAKTIKDGVIADLRAHIGSQKIHDDITLVVIRHR